MCQMTINLSSSDRMYPEKLRQVQARRVMRQMQSRLLCESEEENMPR